MLADCHIHMVLDGDYYKAAIASHQPKPKDAFIRAQLEAYRDMGFTWLRDGGDRWGVGLRARELAKDYGITYRSPAFPIYKKGHYGAFIGRGFADLGEFRGLLAEARAQKAAFIKIMISGLMDFDRFGVITEDGLEDAEVHDLVSAAHDMGFAVMAHGNGSRNVTAAARAGVDSIEHGAYLNKRALEAMGEAGTVWVPTLSTIGNLRGTGRFDEGAVARILESAMVNVSAFAAMGGLLAPGSDAGAFAVPHGRGGQTEYALLTEALGSDAEAVLNRGIEVLMRKF